MNTTSSGLIMPRRNFLKVCAAAGFAAAFPWLAYAAESDEKEAEADALASQAADKQAEADALMTKIDALQDQLNDANKRYEDARAAHDAAVASMQDAERRIKEAEARIAELQVSLSARVNTMYKQGTGFENLLGVLLGATSFEEFATSLDALQRVSDRDAEMVAESKEMRLQAENAHKEYAAQEVIAAEELEKSEAAKLEIETTRDSLQSELDKLNEDILALRYQEEQARISAEEAREKEEQARIAAQQAASRIPSSSTGGGSVTVDGWSNPLVGYPITSGFGYRPSIGDYHMGVDLGAPAGTVAYCMAPGTVTHAGWFGTGGNAVLVSHGSGVVSWYLHASELLVSVGQQVSAGTPVIKVGSTGFSTGPHLHFQININDVAVNPLTYFSW